LKYRWYAVQLDAAHPPGLEERDGLRDTEIAVHGYEVISLKPEKHGYLEEVKTLVERIEREMGAADADMWKHTVRVPVINYTEPDHMDDVPF
jgi:very-short-patch-repair endonuclease